MISPCFAEQSDYFEVIKQKGELIHWDTKKMPLKVFIPGGSHLPGWTVKHRELVINGLKTWQKGSNRKIKFSLVNMPQEADILVVWLKDNSDNTYSHVELGGEGSYLVQSSLVIPIQHNGTLVPHATLQRAVTHEIGHLLGMRGHSDNPDDLMYLNTKTMLPKASKLSARDLATLKILYNEKPDISNNYASSAALFQTYSELLRTGFMAQSKKKFAEAIPHYKKAILADPTRPEAYQYLGLIYQEQGNFKGAIRAFELAVQNGTDKGFVYYSLATSLLNHAHNIESATPKVALEHYLKAYNILNRIKKSTVAHPDDLDQLLLVAKEKSKKINSNRLVFTER